MEIKSKEEFQKVIDSLTFSKNDLFDEIFVLSCSLSFIAEATNTIMDKENSNIMEDVSYGFYSQLNGLKNNLNNLVNEFAKKMETSIDDLYFCLGEVGSSLEELKKDEKVLETSKNQEKKN